MNVIESKVSVFWEIWVEYANCKVEKLATVYRYDMAQDVIKMLKSDPAAGAEFYIEQVAKS